MTLSAQRLQSAVGSPRVVVGRSCTSSAVPQHHGSVIPLRFLFPKSPRTFWDIYGALRSIAAYVRTSCTYVRSDSPINSYMCNAKNKAATSNYPYDVYDVYELSYCRPFAMRPRTLRTERTLIFNSIAIFIAAQHLTAERKPPRKT